MVWWGEASDELAREDARPTEIRRERRKLCGGHRPPLQINPESALARVLKLPLMRG